MNKIPGYKKDFYPEFRYLQAFEAAYLDLTFVQEVLAQLTWYHNITLLQNVKELETRK